MIEVDVLQGVPRSRPPRRPEIRALHEDRLSQAGLHAFAARSGHRYDIMGDDDPVF